MKHKRKRTQLRYILYSSIAGLLLGISALTVFLIQDQLLGTEEPDTGHFQVDGAAEFDGVIRIKPPINMPDFTLSSQNGDSTSLRDLRGRFVLLTFGFTNCPDICPLTLNEFQLVKGLLGDNSHDVAFVFISVDGSRDTPTVLRNFFAFRKLDQIIGLTGAESEVRAAGAPLGLSFERSTETATGSYSVNHTSGSFLLDRRGRWIMRFQFGVPPERITAELRELIAFDRKLAND